MSRLCRLEVFGLALCCVLAASIPAEGQGRGGGAGGGVGGPGGGFGPMSSPFMLLYSEQVQKELKLSEDQKTRLQELAEKRRAERRQRPDNNENLSPEQRRARMEQMREQMQKEAAAREAEMAKQLGEILQAEQLQRLKQIGWQLEGPSALRRAEVTEAIGLTAEQKTQLEQVFTESQDAMRKLWEGNMGRGRGQPGADREERGSRNSDLRQKMEELREQTGQKAMAVLQPEQKQKLGELFGEPFELDRSQLFPNRGREGRRSGPGGDNQERRPQ